MGPSLNSTVWTGESDILMSRMGSPVCEVTATVNHKDWGWGGVCWSLRWGLNSEVCSKNLTTRSSVFSYNEMSRGSAGSQAPRFLGERCCTNTAVALILTVPRVAALQSRQHSHFPGQRKKARRVPAEPMFYQEEQPSLRFLLTSYLPKLDSMSPPSFRTAWAGE